MCLLSVWIRYWLDEHDVALSCAIRLLSRFTFSSAQRMLCVHSVWWMHDWQQAMVICEIEFNLQMALVVLWMWLVDFLKMEHRIMIEKIVCFIKWQVQRLKHKSRLSDLRDDTFIDDRILCVVWWNLDFSNLTLEFKFCVISQSQLSRLIRTWTATCLTFE